MRQRVWTDDKLNWLIKSKNIYDDRQDILEAFNKHYRTNITLKNLRHINTIYKLELPKANKIIRDGLKQGWVALRGFTEKNIGDDIIYGNSTQTFIKINDLKSRKDKYALKKRFLYERYHNVKLASNDCVIFLNGDRKDFSKNNLYRVSDVVNCLMATNNFYTQNDMNNSSKIKFCEWKEKLIYLNERKY